MKVDSIVPNFEVDLTSSIRFDLYQTLQKGPVVINFIMGTWCPMCTSHLQKIRKWQKSLNKNVTMLIISGENVENLRKWSEDNPSSYLFASDSSLEIIELFGLKISLMKMAKPATFLIDSDHKIKIAFAGIGQRTKNKNNIVYEHICETGKCFTK